MKFEWNWYWLNLWLFIMITTAFLIIQFLRYAPCEIDSSLLSMIIYLYSFRQWQIVCDERKEENE